jgi:hypothetical protein
MMCLCGLITVVPSSAAVLDADQRNTPRDVRASISEANNEDGATARKSAALAMPSRDGRADAPAGSER